MAGVLYSAPVPPATSFASRASGAGDEQPIIKSAKSQFAYDWSRDGRWFLYSELTRETSADLWTISVTADRRLAPGATPKPFLRTPFQEASGRFSPDSPPRWVAYQSDVTGRNEIYIQ